MRLALVSDTHEEFWDRFYTQDYLFSSGIRQPMWFEQVIDHNPEFLVLAGDIDSRRASLLDLLKCLREALPNTHILFVDGNHEHYHKDYKTSVLNLQLICSKYGIVFGNNELVEVGGLKFFMGCMWSRFCNNPQTELSAMAGVNDFRLIGGFNTKTSAELCNEFLSKLANCEPDVVVSHFGPSQKSVHESYKGHSLNGYFFDQLENHPELIPSSVKYWLHGHTHTPTDYYLDNSTSTFRVVSNPRGYPTERFSHRHPYRYQPVIMEI